MNDGYPVLSQTEILKMTRLIFLVYMGKSIDLFIIYVK